MRTEVRLAWPGSPTRVGSLLSKGGASTFAYEPAFLQLGLPLNPLRPNPEPLAGVRRGRDGGLLGVLGDAVPDGWGLRVLQARARTLGLEPSSLSPAALLCLVGLNGPGALTFHPEADAEGTTTAVDLAALQHDSDQIHEGAATFVTESARQAMGPSGGARPKVLLDVLQDGTTITGTSAPRPDATSFLIKFPARDDGRDFGRVELAYAAMARAAGITMPPTRAFPLQRGKLVCFGVERFDRPAGMPRPHVLSLAAALEADYRSAFIDYKDYLRATQRITESRASVLEAYRRMLFNVLSGNRDDHLKNFAYLRPFGGAWELAPAFDLVPQETPRHTTSVNGVDAEISRVDCRAAIADTLIVVPAVQKQLIVIEDEVLGAVGQWRRFADAEGVPRKTMLRWASLHATLRRTF